MLQLWQVGRFCHSSPSLGSTCCVSATSTLAKPTHSNIGSVCVPYAAASLLRTLPPLEGQHVVEMVANIVEGGMLCMQSRSKLKAAQHTVQHPFQTHAAVHDCVTAVCTGTPAAKHLVFASHQQLLHCLLLLQHSKAFVRCFCVSSSQTGIAGRMR